MATDIPALREEIREGLCLTRSEFDLSSILDELEALRGEVEKLQTDHKDYCKSWDMRQEMNHLRSAGEKMAEALKPFVEATSHLHPSHPADGETMDGFKVHQFWDANIALAAWASVKEGGE